MNLMKMKIILPAILMIGFVGCDKEGISMANEAKTETTEEKKIDYPKATFAGGCFWGIEHNYRRIPGVIDTAVGFMGGKVKNPSYKQVCDEDTHHAEVVHLSYDPNTISYEKLVKIFFIMHDPTTMNRQGPDVGTQYRSAIFYHDDAQKQTAEKIKADLTAAKKFRRPIVTQVVPAAEFWIAEDYHQQYIEKNPRRSCHMVDHREIQKILKED